MLGGEKVKKKEIVQSKDQVSRKYIQETNGEDINGACGQMISDAR